MQTIEEVKRQFVEQIKLRGYDDKYIDKNEEREVLQIALQSGVTVDNARSALVQSCEAFGYVLETQAISAVKDLLQIQVANDGKIDQKEFNDSLAMLRSKTNGKKSDVQLKRMLVELIEDNSYKTTTGWFSSWFNSVKKEVGIS